MQKNVTRKIQRLHLRRLPLNISAVKRGHPELIQRVYAVRPFWGWKRALEDAGLDYKKINVELRDYLDCKICGKSFGGLGYHLVNDHRITSEEYRQEYPDAEVVSETVRATIARSKLRKRPVILHWEEIWSPEYVLDRMAELRRRRYPLNSDWANKREQALLFQAIKYFGSWDQALQRIGLDPEQVRRAAPTEHLSAADVSARLKARNEAGLGLNSRAVQDEDPPLANAIVKHFRSHDNALRAAGIVPSIVRKRSTYDRKHLSRLFREARHVAELRGEAHRRAWLRFQHKYLRTVWTGRLGGWKGVAAGAGVRVEDLIWKRFRNREDVLEALRNRLERGKSIHGERVLHEDLSLRTAVFKYFGSFEKIYRHFGIRPARESPWRRADKAAIIAELRRRKRAREPLTWREILPVEFGSAFLNRAKELFGSWSSAVAAGGIRR